MASVPLIGQPARGLGRNKRWDYGVMVGDLWCPALRRVDYLAGRGGGSIWRRAGRRPGIAAPSGWALTCPTCGVGTVARRARRFPLDIT